jgi:hypothetical protein
MHTWAVLSGIDSLQEQQFLFVTQIFDTRFTRATLPIFTRIFFFPLSPTGIQQDRQCTR